MARSLGSCARDHGGARPPAGGIFTEPAGGLSCASLFTHLHLHAPGEDPPAPAVDGALAESYTRRAPEPGLEVSGVAGEDVDDAHVALLLEQAGLRRAHLDQLETLPLPVPLREVA